MGDETPASEPELTRSRVRLFNGSTQPRVVAWGEGVIMPGESFETDNPEGYQPDTPGSPWTVDAEASSALLSAQDEGAGDTSQIAADGHTDTQVGPWGVDLHTPDSDGSVTQDEAGESGHEEQPDPIADAGHTTPGGNA